MKVYTKIVCEWRGDQLVRVEEESHEYEGPVDLCGGGGDSGSQNYANLERLYGIQADQAEYLSGVFKENVAPAYKGWLDEAKNYGSQANQEEQASRAGAQAVASQSAQHQAYEENMASMGINPGDQRYAQGERTMAIQGAGQQAAASTTARDNVRTQGFARMQDAIGMGMGTPTQATSAANSAANAANQAYTNQNNQNQQNSNNAGSIARLGANVYGNYNNNSNNNGNNSWGFKDGGEVLRLKSGGYVQRLASGGFAGDGTASGGFMGINAPAPPAGGRGGGIAGVEGPPINSPNESDMQGGDGSSGDGSGDGGGYARGGPVRGYAGGGFTGGGGGGFMASPSIQAPMTSHSAPPSPTAAAATGVAQGLGPSGTASLAGRGIQAGGEAANSNSVASFGAGLRGGKAAQPAIDSYNKSIATRQVDKSLGTSPAESDTTLANQQVAGSAGGDGLDAAAAADAGDAAAADTATATAATAAEGEAAGAMAAGEAVGVAVPYVGAAIALYGIGAQQHWWADGGPVANGPQGISQDGTRGGGVSGPGGPKDDLIDAKLSNGEFVMPVGAVNLFGLDRLEKMRQKGLQHEQSMGITRN